MEYVKNVYMITDSFESYRKWKESKAAIPKTEARVITEGPLQRSIKNRETAIQLQALFEPYLKEIYAQFPAQLIKHEKSGTKFSARFYQN